MFNLSFEAFMQHLANGVAVGSLYALIAIGYTMVYGILRLINFAHADIFMVAAYFMFFGIAIFSIPWWLAIVLTLVLTTFIGIIIERLAYKPLRDAPKMSVMISAIGVSYLLQNLATYIFTGKPKAFPESVLLTKTFSIGGVNLQPVIFVIPAVTIILLVILLFIVNKTKLGMSMRAVSKDYDTAKLMGIRIDKVITYTFGIGSALAVVGSILWCIKYPQVSPTMGTMPGLKCFIAAVIGGIGNIKGAVIGGFILGMCEILLVAFAASLTGYRDALAFVLLIVVLLFRPMGILGEKVADKV